MTSKRTKIRGHFWHIHHTGKAIEWSDNIQERIEVIKYQKSPWERPLRLSVLKPVLDPGGELAKAYRAWRKTKPGGDDYYLVLQGYNDLLRDYTENHHDTECGCMWAFSYQNIFAGMAET